MQSLSKMNHILKIMTILLLSFVLLSGCSIPSIGSYAKSWIGHPIEEKMKAENYPNAYDSYAKSIGWKKGATYQLENGNLVYVELDSKDCFIHWEVNPEGIIIGYKLEGSCY